MAPDHLSEDVWHQNTNINTNTNENEIKYKYKFQNKYKFKIRLAPDHLSEDVRHHSCLPPGTHQQYSQTQILIWTIIYVLDSLLVK